MSNKITRKLVFCELAAKYLLLITVFNVFYNVDAAMWKVKQESNDDDWQMKHENLVRGVRVFL